MNHGGGTILALRTQRLWMNILQRQFVCRLARQNGYSTLICTGPVQPTPLNASYRARIEYRIGGRPRVWVEEPALRRRKPDESVPHTFADGRVCLFLYDFTADMKLATSVVPWLMYWLFFYESWLVTGVWQGEGIHPVADPYDEAVA